MPSTAPELSALSSVRAQDLVPGTRLHGKLCGKLRVVFAERGDAHAHKLRFQLSAHLPLQSAYTADDAPLAPFSVECVLTAPRAGARDTRGDDAFTELSKDRGKLPIVIDLTGARVLSRTAEEGRGKTKVVVEAHGARRLVLRGMQRTLFATSDRHGSSSAAPTVPTPESPGWDFYANDSPVSVAQHPTTTRSATSAAAAPPAPAPIANRRVLDASITATTSVSTFTASRAAVNNISVTNTSTATTRAFRPLSAIPQLTFASRSAVSKVIPRRGLGPTISAPVPGIAPPPDAESPIPVPSPSAPPSPTIANPHPGVDRRTINLTHVDGTPSVITAAQAEKAGRGRQSLPTPSDMTRSIPDPIVVSSSAEAPEGVSEFSPTPATFARYREEPPVQFNSPTSAQRIESREASYERDFLPLRDPTPLDTSPPQTPSSHHDPFLSSRPPSPMPDPPPPESAPYSDSDMDSDDIAAKEEQLAKLMAEVEAARRRRSQRMSRGPSTASPANPPPKRKLNADEAEHSKRRLSTTRRERPRTPSERDPNTPAHQVYFLQPVPQQERSSQLTKGRTSQLPRQAASLRQNGTAGPSRISLLMEQTEEELLPGPEPMSPLAIRRAAEAEVRARAEANVRRTAVNRQEEDAAVAAEAALLADEMRRPFRAGGHMYTPLNMLQNARTMNLMAVVVDPGDLRGGPPRDYYRSVVVTDPSLRPDGLAHEDTVVAMFRKNASHLRGIESGCPILFRGVKISVFKEKLKGQLYSASSNDWVMLRDNGEVLRGPSETGGQAARATPAEYHCLKALKTWWNSLNEGPGPQRREGEIALTKKERQLGEVYNGCFFDATVKVLGILQNDRWRGYRPNAAGHDFPQMELYVTDGTVNAQRTRNFHHFEAGVPPSSVMCLAIFRPPPYEISVGDVFFFPNLRAKDRDGLELKWSDNMNGEQKADGWKAKVARRLDANDPKAKAIEERFKALRAAVKEGRTVEPDFAPPEAERNDDPAPAPVAKLSSAIFTKFSHAVDHPVTPLAEALADPTVPNKYRIQARVTRIEPVPSKHVGKYAITLCTFCNAEFTGSHCQSCNDKTYQHAEARWRLLVFLEIDPDEKRRALESLAAARGDITLPTDLQYPNEVAVLLVDEEAVACLPDLPRLHTGPNEVERARTTIRGLHSRVEDRLLGPNFNGARTRPLIDWSVMKYAVECTVPPASASERDWARERERKKRGAQEREGVLVWRVFGMTAR